MASYSGHFARREIKKRRREFRKTWPYIAAIAIGVSGATGLLLALVFPNEQVPLWLLGPTSALFGLWAGRSQLDGTYYLQSGIEAEGWTSSKLRKAFRRGWHVVNWISFGDQGDVDHVVVGPGGVFAIETKFTDSSQDSRMGREIVEGWIDQSHDGARHVRLLLKHEYGHNLDVAPMVVVSGGPNLKLPPDVEDVYVVQLRNLGEVTVTWLSMPRVLSSEQVESIRAALLDYRGIREEFERARG